jgi:hypothetical protein
VLGRLIGGSSSVSLSLSFSSLLISNSLFNCFILRFGVDLNPPHLASSSSAVSRSLVGAILIVFLF